MLQIPGKPTGINRINRDTPLISVKSGLVVSAETYLWSSARAHMTGTNDSLLGAHGSLHMNRVPMLSLSALRMKRLIMQSAEPPGLVVHSDQRVL